jgi:Mce-associated membrane protein
VTAVIEAPETSSRPETFQVVDETPSTPLAPWWARAAALAVDVLPGTAVVVTAALVALSLPLYGVWWWACVAVGAIAATLGTVNRVVSPAVTGWSLGRAALGVTVVGSSQGAGASPRSVSVRRLLLRELAHVADTVPVCVGWLWPLWDQRRRTFADMLAGTESRRAEPVPRDAAPLVAVVSAAAALLCVLGGAVSYQVVYQHDRATRAARTEITSQGPKIVSEMLSYNPASLQEDFAHAQSLVTDNYRDQLVEQQDAVKEKKPVPNAYLVPNSAVLSAAPRQATMLVFLQGQRGVPGNERMISATVRVNFAKTSGQWRVEDLTVVTKPLPAEDGN